MDKKFEINHTKIKAGWLSVGKKSGNHNSKSDLPLVYKYVEVCMWKKKVLIFVFRFKSD